MLAALGARVRLVGAVGEDRAGELLRQQLRERDVDTSGIVTFSGRSTTVKTRYMGYVQSAGRSLQQMVRVDQEGCQPLRSRDADSILEKASEETSSFLVVQDMDKGLLSPPVVARLISRARRSGRRVLVDPRCAEDYSGYRGAHYVVPNRREAEMATGIGLNGLKAYRRAARLLLDKLELEAAIITLDREGMFYATRYVQKEQV